MCIVVDRLRFYAGLDPQKFVSRGHPLAVLLTLGLTVFFFLVQMLHVAPQLLSQKLYNLYWIPAIFVVHNILGNMLACYLTTSSVARLTEDRKVPVPEENHLWRYCDACENLAPPRSWHCKLCKCCILKRDHHCIFTATCIGHHNHRYFFWFTFYLTLGASVCFATTAIIMLRDYGLFQIIYPYFSWNNLLISITGFAWTGPFLMLAFQIQVVYLNAVYYKIDNRTYDLGVKGNWRLIMGERGLWTFLSPLIKSPLPHDGTQWQIKPREQS